MHIEQTENSYRVYLTKEETALLDEEDKKLLKPCNKTIYSFQFKLPEGVASKHYCNVITPTDEGIKVEQGEIDQEKMKAEMKIDGKPMFINNEPIKLDSLEELKATIEAKYNKNNIEIL